MASGLEILGAVAAVVSMLDTAVTLLNTVPNTAKAERRVGRKVALMRLDIGASKVGLNNWQKKWGVHETDSEKFCLAFWGETGLRTIQSELAVIDSKCADFTVTISKLVGTNSLNDPKQTAKIEVLEARFSNFNSEGEQLSQEDRNAKMKEFHELGRLTQKTMSIWDKLDYVFFKSKHLLDELPDIRERIDRLKTDSEEFFQAQYPDIATSASMQERRKRVLSGITLQVTLAGKAASEALHDSCTSASRGTYSEKYSTEPGHFTFDLPGLELNLLCDDSGPGPRLKYRLVLSRPGEEEDLEILVEGPVRPEEEEKRFDFQSACAKLMAFESGSCIFEAKSERYADAAAVFRMTRSKDPIEVRTYGKVDLKKVLRGLAENQNWFPFSLQAILAYKVVMNGLALLGTSWLSHLTSQCVQRIPENVEIGNESTYRFLLDVSNRSALDTVEPHIFNIGVLLAEIILQSPVEEIKMLDTGAGTEPHLVMKSPKLDRSDARPLSCAVVVRHVKVLSVPLFANVVDFCLQQSVYSRRRSWCRARRFRTWEEQTKAYEDVLADYYDEVYLP